MRNAAKVLMCLQFAVSLLTLVYLIYSIKRLSETKPTDEKAAEVL